MRFQLLAACLAIAAIAGCYSGSAVDTNRQPEPPSQVTTSTNGTEPANTDSPAVAPASGLPCDVAVLIKTCDGCHGAPTTNDAPNSFVSYEDLAAKSASDPTKTVAGLALARMKSTKRPMPPDGNLGADEIAILGNWIDAGMPRGSCGAAQHAQPDGGTPIRADGGSNEASAPPPQSVCTSGVTADPTVASPEMQPGNACINCHSGQIAAGNTDAPDFEVGGTVYKTKYEPNGCNGIDATTGTDTGTKVLIIDRTGTMRSFNVNSAGNFYGGSDIQVPYRAMIVRGNSIREMHGAQTTGDCNSCHTEFGNGAPGRVMEP